MIQYYYDNANRLSKVTDYDGNDHYYTYDGANRLASVKLGNTVLEQYTYNTAGALSTVQNALGHTTHYTYDNALRVTDKTTYFGVEQVYADEMYTYDVLGNQTRKTESSSEDGFTNGQTVYTYDDAGRLTSFADSDYNGAVYTYDAGDNLVAKSLTHADNYTMPVVKNGTTINVEYVDHHNISYTYNAANQLISSVESGRGFDDAGLNGFSINRTYTNDANGNTTAITASGYGDTQTESFSYNAKNQLVGYTKGNTNITYGYDGTGVRVSKTQGNTTQKFYWDRGNIINESTNGTMKATNAFGATGIIARQEPDSLGNDTITFMHKNLHGDVIATFDEDGALLSSYVYDAYGVEIYPNANDTNPFRYAGEYFDAESGQIYLRNRYYNPATGRFTQEDPIRDGTNWYVYCAGNPVMYVDPSGNDPIAAAEAFLQTPVGQQMYQYIANWASQAGVSVTNYVAQNFPQIQQISTYVSQFGSAAWDWATNTAAPWVAEKVQQAGEMIGDTAKKVGNWFKEQWNNVTGGDPGDPNNWNKGSFETSKDSLEYHFKIHGEEVGAKNIEQYVRKAEEFSKNLKGAQKQNVDGYVDGVIRYIKNGKYIDIAPDGTIISFGKR